MNVLNYDGLVSFWTKAKNYIDTKEMTEHTQAASTITSGTLSGQVIAQTDTDYTTAALRNVAFNDTDPGENTSSNLPNGSVLMIYE